MSCKTLNSIANPFLELNQISVRLFSCSFNSIKARNSGKLCNKFFFCCIYKQRNEEWRVREREIERKIKLILTLFIIALPFCSAISTRRQSGISSADKHQRRFHQTLLHFIYENNIFLIGLFSTSFISFSLRDVSNRLFYGIQQKSDILKYSFSIVIQIFFSGF